MDLATLDDIRFSVLGIRWIEPRANYSRSDVQILQMYSKGVRPFSILSGFVTQIPSGIHVVIPA